MQTNILPNSVNVK